MKALFVLLLFGIFQANIVSAQENILITSESPNGRSLVIEGDQHSVYAYIMKRNGKEVAFDGFLCSIAKPQKNSFDIKKVASSGAPPPLIEKFSNQYSHVKNLQEKDIEVKWRDKTVEVFIRGEKYLIMDMKRQLSYSKALIADGPYGNAMAH